MLKSGAVLVFGLGMAKLLVLAAHLLITNLGGASVYGIFSLALIPINILTFAGLGGLQHSVIKFGTPLTIQNAVSRDFTTLVRTIALTTASLGSLLALILALAAPLIGEHFFGKAEVVSPLRVLALSLPFINLMTILCYAFRATGDFVPDMAIRNILRGISLLAGIALVGLLLPPLTPIVAAWSFTMAAVISCVVAMWLFFRFTATAFDTSTETPPYVRDMLKFGAVMTVGIVTHEILTVVDRTLLGRFAETAVVGAFAGAALLARQTEFGAVVLHGLLSQKLSGDASLVDSKKFVLKSVVFSVFFYSAVIAVCIFAAPLILGLLGAEFVSVKSEFIILIIGYSLFSISTPLSTFVQFRGRTGYDVAIEFTGVIISSAVGLSLIPAFGSMGAAWGTTSAMLAISVARFGVFVFTNQTDYNKVDQKT